MHANSHVYLPTHVYVSTRVSIGTYQRCPKPTQKSSVGRRRRKPYRRWSVGMTLRPRRWSGSLHPAGCTTTAAAAAPSTASIVLGSHVTDVSELCHRCEQVMSHI